MVSGRVDAVRRCFIALSLRGPDGAQQTIDALLDTGFNGELMLPLRTVQALGLVQQDSIGMRVADGRRVDVPVYGATLDWHGTPRTVNIVASGKQPLLGTALLNGSRLTVDYVIGGSVILEPLP